MTQAVDKWAIADEPERQAILKALAIAIAAMDLNPSARLDGDRRDMADLLTRLADESGLDRYGKLARNLIIEIATG